MEDQDGDQSWIPYTSAEEGARFLPKADLPSTPAETRTSQRSPWPRISILIHAFIACVWLSCSYAIVWKKGSDPSSRESPGLWDLEFAPAAEAIEYQTTVFEASGLDRTKPLNEYEGPPNRDNNMKWYELIDVGMYVLTDQEAAQLKHPTSRIYGDSGGYMIQIEVFHQLHCLNALRKLAYGIHELGTGHTAQVHADHCIDYLRQVLMCHSDVTPLTHVPRTHEVPGQPPWAPQFAIPHTCRDFWRIHDWAAKRNTSGFVIQPHPDYPLPPPPD